MIAKEQLIAKLTKLCYRVDAHAEDGGRQPSGGIDYDSEFNSGVDAAIEVIERLYPLPEETP